MIVPAAVIETILSLAYQYQSGIKVPFQASFHEKRETVGRTGGCVRLPGPVHVTDAGAEAEKERSTTLDRRP